MSRRPGMAIIMLLVFLLLVEGMVAGMLALGIHARADAAARQRIARADAAAQLAVQHVLADWSNARFDTLPAGAIVAGPGPAAGESDVVTTTEIERLAGSYIIRADARAGSAATYARARAAAHARTLSAAAVTAELPAATTTPGQVIALGGALVSGADSTCAATGGGALLTRMAPVLDPTTIVTGAIVVDTALARPATVAIGGLTWTEIMSIADRVEAGTVSPQPADSSGTCTTAAAANWGDPAGGSCVGYAPLIYAPADLTVTGGVGQGVLVVDGSLAMLGQLRFEGAIVARDGVSLGHGVTITGAVGALHGPVVIDGATIVHSSCAIARAIAAAPAARRLVAQRRRHLPVF